MFERYTEPARRAIFFAYAVTVLNEAPAIDSVNILCGLIWEEDSRAQTIFHLRERFPMYKGCPRKLEDLPEQKNMPPLTDDSKRILAYAAMEAWRLQDYWIDTEHLLLGILRERDCQAAAYLAKAGLDIDVARRGVEGNQDSRPNYGLTPLSWRIKTLPLKLISRWRGRSKKA